MQAALIRTHRELEFCAWNLCLGLLIICNLHQLCVFSWFYFLQGFNAAVLAYGQTGSGKTFTMGTSGPMRELVGASSGNKPRGIIPRLIKSLFAYAAAASCAYDIRIQLQYIEIYNEQV